MTTLLNLTTAPRPKDPSDYSAIPHLFLVVNKDPVEGGITIAGGFSMGHARRGPLRQVVLLGLWVPGAFMGKRFSIYHGVYSEVG